VSNERKSRLICGGIFPRPDAGFKIFGVGRKNAKNLVEQRTYIYFGNRISCRYRLGEVSVLTSVCLGRVRLMRLLPSLDLSSDRGASSPAAELLMAGNLISPSQRPFANGTIAANKLRITPGYHRHNSGSQFLSVTSHNNVIIKQSP
jgi:hypothetical protein